MALRPKDLSLQMRSGKRILSSAKSRVEEGGRCGISFGEWSVKAKVRPQKCWDFDLELHLSFRPANSAPQRSSAVHRGRNELFRSSSGRILRRPDRGRYPAANYSARRSLAVSGVPPRPLHPLLRIPPPLHHHSSAIPQDMTGVEDLILVTGGSGFLGSHVVIQLLQQGLSVRTTVRSQSRAEDAKAKLKYGGATEEQLTRLEIVILDLVESSDQEWAAACNGAKYVLHTAGMIATGKEKTYQELLTPLRDGTLRLLRASVAAGVKRFIFTSSIAAIAQGHGIKRTKSRPFTEEDWSDLTDAKEKLHVYPRAKTMQEQAVWEFMKADGNEMELVVICPAAIYGPTMSKEFASSLKLIPILLGGMPGTPQYGTGIVDVRDVADLHLRAMISEKANGQRYLAISGRADELQREDMVCEFVDIMAAADFLRENLPKDKIGKIPTRKLPNFVMRAAGYFDPVVSICLPDLGKESSGSSAKARRELGWKPRTVDEALLSSARSLMEFEVV